MPFKSDAQRRYMFWAENRGKIPKGTSKRWAKETPNIEDLPERAKKKKKRIKKAAFDIGIATAAIKFLKSASDYSGFSSSASAAKGKGLGSFLPNKDILNKINQFMETETASSMAEKIEKDKTLSRGQKDKIISNIMGFQQHYGGMAKDYTLAGEATGLVGGALLSYLLMRNSKIKSPMTKALLGGAIMLASGVTGNLVGKSLGSGFKQAKPGPIRYSKWKGFRYE